MTGLFQRIPTPPQLAVIVLTVSPRCVVIMAHCCANGLEGVERQLIRGKLLHNLASFRQLGRRRPRALFWHVDYIIAHPGKKKELTSRCIWMHILSLL